MGKNAISLTIALCFLLPTASAFGGWGAAAEKTVYVPATYVDLNHYDAQGNLIYEEFSMSRLYFRNTDPNKSVTLTSVDFYDPDGNLVKEYLTEPQILGPLASVSFAANWGTLQEPPYENNGGRPCFIVKWKPSAAFHRLYSFERVNPPSISALLGVRRPVEGLPGVWATAAFDVVQGIPISGQQPFDWH
ncbi:MAG: DUF3124 domain-containing protein [Thermodesulfobacteriota bacterium]|nr:DUF3124 domain-containing protein [Thermodesulfobacteriota bacterium]